VGGTILAALSHLNPIGSAQAAEAPPTAAPPSAPPAAPAAPAAAPAAPPAAALPTGQTGIGAALNPPGQAAKPATPASPAQATGTPSEQAPAPVPVKGAQGAVAPNQQGPSQQSQSTQPPTGLPVNPTPWRTLQHDFPQAAQKVKDLVSTWGAGVVFPDQVAAHWQREGGLNWNVPRGHDGEYGPMQVMPDTWNLVAQKAREAGKILDPNNPEDGMIAGILYLRHLAVDRGLGANSVSTNYAYMAGPGGARNANFDFGAESRSHADKVKSLLNMYPGIKLDGTNFTPGSGGVDEHGYMRTLLAQNTPDGVLTTMATMGPQGLGMTDRWRHLQGMMEGAAIASGHYDMLPHIADFVAQTAHQGAVSNLAAGYSAMQSGNMQGAAQALAKAHAFFPDGSYARFGVDKQNRLFAEQFDERTGQALGKPFMVTQPMIAQQMIALQNPRTFLETLQKYQKTNAEIGLANAHAQYYQQLPDIKADQLAARQQLQDERLSAAAREHELQRQHQDELAGAKNEANRADSDKVRADINKDYGPDHPDYPQPPKPGATPAEQQAYRDARNGFSQRAEVDTHLRLSPNIGGAGMSGPAGRDMADRVVRGEVILRSIQTKEGWRGYGLFDKDDAKGEHPHGFVDDTHGAAILRGLGRAAQPIDPRKQAAISPVGAGAGSQLAMSQGYNQNLAGIPTQAA